MADTNKRKTEARALKLADVPRHLRGKFQAAFAGRSRKAAIQAFCIECFGYERGRVADCTDYGCPLWEWRRGQRQ